MDNIARKENVDSNDINDMLDHFDIRALPTSIGEFVCWLVGDCVLRHGLLDVYREHEKRLLDAMVTHVDPEWTDDKKDAFFLEAHHQVQVAVMERVVAVFKSRKEEESEEDGQAV
jgi:hypothetical protein